MRVLVHDFSGHPFQVQLSRELATRGHEVLHVHCTSYLSGKGALARSPSDVQTLEIHGVALRSGFATQASARRFLQERAFGHKVAALVRRFRPSVVLSSNAPLYSQRILLRQCERIGARFVFWQQDIYSAAMASAVARIPVLGKPLGRSFTRLERRMVRQSDHVICISPAFARTLQAWGVPADHVSVIPNWAPLPELPRRDRSNAWSREHGLGGKFVFLYAGTLGRKHDPGLLVELARHFRHRPDVVVVVVSEGERSRWLQATCAELALPNLRVLPFQPYERMADMLASGDVLVALLEAEAGEFSVPSKVLSYQCAARAILAAAPIDNLAGQLLLESASGVVVPAGDSRAFLDAAERLASDGDLRARLGDNGRRHASRAFDISAIGTQFETILTGGKLDRARS